MRDAKTVLLLTKEHFRRILNDTELLLRFMEIYGFKTFERAIEYILDNIMAINSMLEEAEKRD
jgi:hypothetical protein